jgi:CSLREA domain-containing protein
MRAILRAAFASAFLACSGAAAFATDYTVTKTADTNDGVCDADCSLREAIIAANNHAGTDRVILGTGLTYFLTRGPADPPGAIVPGTGDLDITDSLIIEGNGSTIDAGGLDRVLHIEGGAGVTINNLTVRGGSAAGFLSLGGGIYVHSAPSAPSALVLNNCVVTGNSTAIESGARDDGGGIAVVGSYNPATGATTQAWLTLNNTTVSGNSGSNGGGIQCVLCALVGTNATVSGNTSASGDGGGIAIVGNASSASLNGGTLSANTGALRGGALSVAYGTGTVGLTRNRIASNAGATGSALFNGTATLTAANNWWGCNFGPGLAGPGCAATANGVAGAVTTAPYLVLRATATPAALTMPSTSSLLVDMTINSANTDTSAGGTVPNGIDIGFSSTLGVLSIPAAVTAGGKATDVFSAGGIAGTASLSTSVDSQTVSATIAIAAPAFHRRVANDVDGDGLADLIVWRAPVGTWYWLNSSTGYSYASALSKQWGSQAAGDVPFVGDIDGDGIADLIVWRSSTGTWYWLTSSTNYNYASAGSKQWGNLGLGDVPKIADMDGDGKADLVVWRASTGTWYWLTSSSG